MTPHLFIELPVGTLFLQYIQSRLVSPPLLLFFPLFFYDSICCQHALYNIYVRMGISLIFKYQLKIFSYHILSYIIFMSIQHLIYVTIYLDQKEKRRTKKTYTLVSHRWLTWESCDTDHIIKYSCSCFMFFFGGLIMLIACPRSTMCFGGACNWPEIILFYCI